MQNIDINPSGLSNLTTNLLPATPPHHHTTQQPTMSDKIPTSQAQKPAQAQPPQVRLSSLPPFSR